MWRVVGISRAGRNPVDPLWWVRCGTLLEYSANPTFCRKEVVTLGAYQREICWPGVAEGDRGIRLKGLVIAVRVRTDYGKGLVWGGYVPSATNCGESSCWDMCVRRRLGCLIAVVQVRAHRLEIWDFVWVALVSVAQSVLWRASTPQKSIASSLSIAVDALRVCHTLSIDRSAHVRANCATP